MKYVATIGMFDGVHRGHQCLIDQVKSMAGERAMPSMLITMDRHPREVITGKPTPLLTAVEDKMRLLDGEGVDKVEVLPFTRDMAALTAREFMREVLCRRLGVGVLVMGYDHRFGHDGRTATIDDYVRWGREEGLEVVQAKAMDDGDEQVSSSAVRRALEAGDVCRAAGLLGHFHTVHGVVVPGKHLGRTIGFPTANIRIDSELLVLPRDGVYAVLVDTPSMSGLAGMLNFGCRPTVDDDKTLTIEVHVFDLNEDLYGQRLAIHFVKRIRDIVAFGSLEALRRQLAEDKCAARLMLAHLPGVEGCGRAAATLSQDEIYMRRCLQLAQCAGWHAAPNPMVGAVVVHNGRVIGEGYHRRCGEAHAEVNAIASVSDPSLLPESTIYVSLEPCAHWGKTPPCADLIAEKRIPRVVIGCTDPFAKVNGLGIKKLLDAGCDVKVGVLEDECVRLNRHFFTFHSLHRPYVTLKWAQSSDGFIDSRRKPGDGQRPVVFSSPLSAQDVHRMRVEHQAILVGAGTLILDNPSLTARHWPGRQPVKVVMQGRRPLPDDSKALADDNTIVYKEKTVEEVLGDLYNRGIQSVLVEGGRTIHKLFLDSGLYDEIMIETAGWPMREGVMSALF